MCKSTKYTIICAHCSKDFTVTDCEIDRKYCSKQCYNDAHKSIPKTCLNCGKGFSVAKSLDNNIKNYCSLDCRKEHNNWNKPRYCVDCGKQIKNKKALRCTDCAHKFASGENNPKWVDRVDVKCVYCGKEMKRVPSLIKGMCFCSKRCKNNWMSENLRGENNANWTGNNIRTVVDLIRRVSKYSHWRVDVFEMDKYTCQKCNKVGGYLHAHHIKTFNEIIVENNIQDVMEALKCDILWDINNGITYCKDCHSEVHGKKRKEAICQK